MALIAFVIFGGIGLALWLGTILAMCEQASPGEVVTALASMLLIVLEIEKITSVVERNYSTFEKLASILELNCQKRRSCRKVNEFEAECLKEIHFMLRHGSLDLSHSITIALVNPTANKKNCLDTLVQHLLAPQKIEESVVI